MEVLCLLEKEFQKWAKYNKMLKVCKRMASSIASLKIPQISQRMSVNFIPRLEASFYVP